MKTQLLSIFSDSTEKSSAAPTSTETQPRVASYRARYQEFLSQGQQSPFIQTRSYYDNSAFRFIQGVFSLAVFVVLFLAILTLFGFGLSSLGVIAQVSPKGASASSKQNNTPAQTLPTKPESKKKARRQQ